MFYALWPDDTVRAGLRARAGLIPPGGQGVDERDYHLTLAFAGGVGESALARLTHPPAERVARFTCHLERLEYWPKARVAVLVPSAVPAALGTLASMLRRFVAEITGGQGAEDYRPHVTLARAPSAPVPARDLPPLAWEAGDYVLCASHPERHPRYHILARWRLA